MYMNIILLCVHAQQSPQSLALVLLQCKLQNTTQVQALNFPTSDKHNNYYVCTDVMNHVVNYVHVYVYNNYSQVHPCTT